MATYWDQASGPVLLDTSEDLSRSNIHTRTNSGLDRVGIAHTDFGLRPNNN